MSTEQVPEQVPEHVRALISKVEARFSIDSFSDESSRIYARAMAAAALGWDPTVSYAVFCVVMGVEPEFIGSACWPQPAL